ncbi:MAG: hypothetical protein LHW56_10770 [Candidatus Cloacimonetes bacterium]|jgi:hypothetical protein|nr:hypothetical protein [Candidatus Cloacimonadota bacterium]MDY0173375.1 hypothetical protein [Candidatus Cloacimonadaceae bacterium]
MMALVMPHLAENVWLILAMLSAVFYLAILWIPCFNSQFWRDNVLKFIQQLEDIVYLKLVGRSKWKVKTGRSADWEIPVSLSV